MTISVVENKLEWDGGGWMEESREESFHVNLKADLCRQERR